MPDLTLYEDDVELIRDALAAYGRELRSKYAASAAHCSVTEEITSCERLGDLLLDRLVQRLHPKRPARVELDFAVTTTAASHNMNIILCHKCKGLLQGRLPYKSYGCHCISGYVRNWQTPIIPVQALAEQKARLKSSLELYDRQQRSASDSNRVWAQGMLGELEGV